tara:strand:- start:862 stop:1140 length:279 start_codon:yes stop_codon:yes gene_type:complete
MKVKKTMREYENPIEELRANLIKAFRPVDEFRSKMDEYYDEYGKPSERPPFGEAVLEIEGLVNEEVSKLVKKGDIDLANKLKMSMKTLKRGF